MKKAGLIASAGVILIGTAGWLTSRLPLDIVVDGLRATASVEALGEYPSNVRSIELTEADNAQVIWRVVADAEMVQLHQVPFIVGQNAAMLETSWGEARTQIPSNAAAFVLVAGREYELRVCPASSWRPCVSETFRLGPA